MFQQDVDLLVQQMGAITRPAKNAQGIIRGLIFKNCPFCMGYEVSTINYETGNFGCKQCGTRYSLKEMTEQFAAAPKAEPDRDHVSVEPAEEQCTRCHDRGAILYTDAESRPYMKPCTCQTGRTRYAGVWKLIEEGKVKKPWE